MEAIFFLNLRCFSSEASVKNESFLDTHQKEAPLRGRAFICCSLSYAHLCNINVTNLSSCHDIWWKILHLNESSTKIWQPFMFVIFYILKKHYKWLSKLFGLFNYLMENIWIWYCTFYLKKNLSPNITGVIIEVVGFFLPNSSIFDASKFERCFLP